MSRFVPRAAVAALLAGLAGAAFLVAAFNWHPDVTFEMDRDLPRRTMSGFYPVEFSPEESFSWTSDRAQLSIPGLDRRPAWRCLVRFRGSRSADLPQPTVTIAVDGQPLATRLATNDYETLEAIAPPRSTRGLRLTITSSETFVPGPSDPRQLGVRVDRLTCAPADGSGLVFPPPGTIAAASASAAIFGAAFGLIGLGSVATLAGALLLAAIQAFPVSIGLAPYTAYAGRVVWLALWIAGTLVVGAATLQWLRRPLGSVAGLAAAFSAAALFVKLLALLHPSKAIIDALFHAHRLEYVLSGRYFFTQVMPGDVQFPYAIALYVFAAPWAVLTRDHIALLRVVVSATEAAAGILLYWAVVRSWREPLIAAAALVLFHLVPVSYWVVGNANLTNAFGQSAALATMTALVAWKLEWRHWLQLLALSVLAALAFLSHVSTFALLVVTMLAAAGFYYWGGGRSYLAPARSIVLAVLIAGAASVVLYYGRPEFFEAYRSVRGARAESSGPADLQVQPEGVKAPPGPRLAEGAIPTMSLPARVANAIGLAGDALGWPIVALGLLGLWRVLAERASDRLTWALAAWGLAFGGFFVFGILAPGGVGHQRQAMEFIARAVYAGSPAVVVLAGRGGIWAWRTGTPLRIATILLLGLSTFEAARQWMTWIR